LKESGMAAVDLKTMDVDALLTLRGDVERMLAEKGRDLQRQLARLGGGGEIKRRGRPAGKAGRTSAMKGVKVAPKYRGPDGETWAGRGATPRWLSALIKEGHSVEEFLIGAGGKRKPAATKKKVMKKKVAKPARKPRQRKEKETKAEPVAT
jgi:DNA-binding protein H-NS